MNDDYLLAITVLSMLVIFVLLISTFITGAIYLITLFIFHFKIGIALLAMIEIVFILLIGIILYLKINKC